MRPTAAIVRRQLHGEAMTRRFNAMRSSWVGLAGMLAADRVFDCITLGALRRSMQSGSVFDPWLG
jgi:hypothetical protein